MRFNLLWAKKKRKIIIISAEVWLFLMMMGNRIAGVTKS